MGRPTDLTEAVAFAICEKLEEGCTLSDAAALAGINATTVYGWNTKGRAGIEPYAAFVEATARAKAGFRKSLIDQVNMYAGADQPQSWRCEPLDAHTQLSPESISVPGCRNRRF